MIECHPEPNSPDRSPLRDLPEWRSVVALTQATEVRLRRAQSDAEVRHPRPSRKPAEHRIHCRSPKLHPTTPQRRGGDPRRPADAAAPVPSTLRLRACCRPLARCPPASRSILRRSKWEDTDLRIGLGLKEHKDELGVDGIWGWICSYRFCPFPPFARVTTVAPNEAEGAYTPPSRCNDENALRDIRFPYSHAFMFTHLMARNQMLHRLGEKSNAPPVLFLELS